MSRFTDPASEVHRQEFFDASIFAVEVTTTGPKGGDGGHGGRTSIAFEDSGDNTGWDVEIDGKTIDQPKKVTLTFAGDSEGSNLIEALEYAAARLRREWASSPDAR